MNRRIFNQPQDFISQEYAAPQERAFQNNNPFEVNGIGFQGAPDFEPYEVGTDYQGLASLDGLPQGVGIGVESNGEGLMRVGVYPNPIRPFVDSEKPYDTLGMDAMSGVTYPVVPAELANQSMYLIGGRAVSAEEYYGQRPANTDE